MNEKSSRSHLKFTIYLENKINHQTSKFNILDLAGSEKAGEDYKKKSSSKLVLEEGTFINTSLMDLRLLIKKIANREKISYNANSLTKILRDSLGGNSFSLMIACIDSRTSCYSQTIETLSFANTVKSIKVNPLKMSTLNSTLDNELNILRNLKKIIRSKIN